MKQCLQSWLVNTISGSRSGSNPDIAIALQPAAAYPDAHPARGGKHGL